MKSLSLSSPHIIAMIGIPGAGKTQFADAFSKTFSAPFINHHQLRKIDEDSPEVSTATSEILEQVMRTKQTIVYENSLRSKADRSRLSRLAKDNGYDVLFVWVQTDPKTAKQRTFKQLAEDEFEKLTRQFTPPSDNENYLVISGHHTYSTQLRTVLKRLSDTSRPAETVPTRSVSSTANRIHIN